MTKGCTEELVRLTKKVGESMKSTAYCRMCVQKDTRDRTHREKQKGAKTSAMGCNQCQEPIYKAYWTEGYHTGTDTINSKYICLKCFTGPETW